MFLTMAGKPRGLWGRWEGWGTLFQVTAVVGFLDVGVWPWGGFLRTARVDVAATGVLGGGVPSTSAFNLGS